MTDIALHPDLDKALRDMFVRMKKQERTISQDVTREIIRPVMTGGGTGIAPTAIPDLNVGGDLSGTLSDVTVEAIQGIIIAGVPTALDDILVITDLSPLTATWAPNPAIEDKHFVHDQASASATWNITHNLGKFPSVTITDSSGNEVEGQVSHTSANALVITFSASFAGKAYLN